MADEVLAAMQPFWKERFFNSSALYLAARDTKKALDKARSDVAFWLGAKPGEIIFTAGATEANYLALVGVSSAVTEGEVIVGSTEHAAVLETAKELSAQIAPVDIRGRIDLTRLRQMISDKTALVSIHYANNETGTIQPLKQIAKLVGDERKRRRKAGERRPIYFHSDASQAAQYLDLHTNRLGVDIMTVSAAKIYGPKQVAALYIRSGTQINPVLRGGGQERGLRSGTQNVAGAVGLAAALKLVQTNRQEESDRVAELRDVMQNALPQEATVNGDNKHRLPNFLHISVAGRDGERLVMELDEAGVQAATGAACSANKDVPSHVLAAMALTEGEIQGSVRFSLGRFNSRKDIDKTISIIKQIV